MCSAAISAAEQGQFRLVTSMLTMIEVVKGETNTRTPSPEVRQMITAYFDREHILMGQATRDVMRHARIDVEIRRDKTHGDRRGASRYRARHRMYNAVHL